MDDGDILGVLHDAFDRIGHVEDEAGGELALWLSSVYEARRVRDELACKHCGGHLAREAPTFFGIRLGPRDMTDDTTHNVSPGLDRLAVFVLERIPFGNDFLSVEPQRSDLTADGGTRASSIHSDQFAGFCGLA